MPGRRLPAATVARVDHAVDRRPRRIALVTIIDHAVVAGMRAHLGREREWSFEVLPVEVRSLRDLAADPPDGVIAYLDREELVDAALALPCPVVNHSGRLAVSRVPRVRWDEDAIGRRAAEHLLDRGHRALAVVATSGDDYAQRRAGAFAAAATAAGATCARLDLPREAHARRLIDQPGTRDQASAWLRGLGAPCGVYATQDTLALRVGELCRHLDLPIPQELALLGTDDHWSCALLDPPLSSVALPGRRQGAACCALLERLMAGERVIGDALLPPGEVQARGSTDRLAVGDQRVATALAEMERQLDRPVSFAAIAKRVGVARRTLEQAFRQALGRSPLDELNRRRIARAKDLLRRTRMPIAEIARACGLGGRTWFERLFRRRTGMTPGEYRKC